VQKYENKKNYYIEKEVIVFDNLFLALCYKQ